MGPVLLPTPLLPARGLLFRRTFQEALGARCLISQRVGSISSPALAPASGFASLLVLLFLTEVFPSGICLSTLPRPIPLSRLLLSSGWISPKRLPSIDPQPGSWPIQRICDRVLLNQLGLLPVCTFCMPSLKDRVDNHHCVGCSEKLS